MVCVKQARMAYLQIHLLFDCSEQREKVAGLSALLRTACTQLIVSIQCPTSVIGCIDPETSQ